MMEFFWGFKTGTWVTRFASCQAVADHTLNSNRRSSPHRVPVPLVIPGGPWVERFPFSMRFFNWLSSARMKYRSVPSGHRATDGATRHAIILEGSVGAGAEAVRDVLLF